MGAIQLEEFPNSRYVNEARLLMSKARYYRSDYDVAIADLKVIIKNGPNKLSEEAKYWQACANEGIEFLPMVVETLGGWHPEASEVVTKLAQQH